MGSVMNPESTYNSSHPSLRASELRRDLVSGDWVAIATGRAMRPHDFLSQPREAFGQPADACPFEALEEDALLVLTSDGAPGSAEDWWVEVIPNKYPAFQPDACPTAEEHGPYERMEGVGHHEVVVSRDHDRSFALMSAAEAEAVVRAYQERYQTLAAENCVRYVSIFHNHGRLSGATISHPHSQIIAIPVVPPDVLRSLSGSARYFKEYGRCVHCVALEYESRERERIVAQNDLMLVLAPFASKTAFELRVFPKNHAAHFERINAAERSALAEALAVSLAKLHRGLENPDYNLFLHTAPPDERDGYDHYHWHFEILPKTSIWAGFEIGTGIEISAIAPESAAEFLRGIEVSTA